MIRYRHDPSSTLADVPDLYRRVLFIAVIPLLEKRAHRAIFGCVLSVMSLYAHTNIKPYTKTWTNILAEIADYQVRRTVTISTNRRVEILSMQQNATFCEILH